MAKLRLIFLAALAFAAFTYGRADATLCTVPNVFTNGSTINAAPFNANFSALQTCGNNLDNSQVGSAGFYASNLKPTSVPQATFGGSVGYLFPNYVVAGSATSTTPGPGTLESSNSATSGSLILGGNSSHGTIDWGATLANVFSLTYPLEGFVFNGSGIGVNSASHAVFITQLVTLNGSCSGISQVAQCAITGGAVSITGNSAYTSATSYACPASLAPGSLPGGNMWATYVSTNGTSGTITLYANANFSNGATITVQLSCSGY